MLAAVKRLILVESASSKIYNIKTYMLDGGMTDVMRENVMGCQGEIKFRT